MIYLSNYRAFIGMNTVTKCSTYIWLCLQAILGVFDIAYVNGSPFNIPNTLPVPNLLIQFVYFMFIHISQPHFPVSKIQIADWLSQIPRSSLVLVNFEGVSPSLSLLQRVEVGSEQALQIPNTTLAKRGLSTGCHVLCIQCTYLLCGILLWESWW